MAFFGPRRISKNGGDVDCHGRARWRHMANTIEPSVCAAMRPYVKLLWPLVPKLIGRHVQLKFPGLSREQWEACYKCVRWNTDAEKTVVELYPATERLAYSKLYILAGGAVVQRVRHLGLRSVGRGFKSWWRQRCVTTLGKLFTPMCLCHQAV